uniref:Uncharacterized protein n=1 Tax=Dulem virus 36 TaxID=3145754 RepID=A0AAU8B0C7_9CAUD
MYLTKQEAVILHRQLWYKIAVETLKQKCAVGKREVIKTMTNKLIRNNCFCCEYVNNVFDFKNCVLCPIEWDTKQGKCIGNVGEHGLYDKWIEIFYLSKYTKYKQAALLAYKISKLPERSEINN